MIFRKGSTCAGLIGSVALLFTLAAQANAAKLPPFKPGHYLGVTSQSCPAEPVPAGACQAGERLPISFTVTKSSVKTLKVVVVEACEDSVPSIVLTISEPRKWKIGTLGKRAGFFEKPGWLNHGTATNSYDSTVFGTFRGNKSSGELESHAASGQLDPEDNVACWVQNLHWQARRQ